MMPILKSHCDARKIILCAIAFAAEMGCRPLDRRVVGMWMEYGRNTKSSIELKIDHTFTGKDVPLIYLCDGLKPPDSDPEAISNITGKWFVDKTMLRLDIISSSPYNEGCITSIAIIDNFVNVSLDNCRYDPNSNMCVKYKKIS